MAMPNASGKLDVSVRNRSNVLFDGKVNSVTSHSGAGEFDVLPQHANFVTLIKDMIVINKGRSDEKKIEVKSGGLMNVGQDKIDVYLGI